MRHVLIATHGKIASGFRSALKLFLNEAGDIAVINAYVGDAGENYEAELEHFLEGVQETDEAYIFTDIKAGSVNQKVIAAVNGSGKPVTLVTNINLPLLVGLLVEKEVKTPEEIEKIIQENQPEVITLEALLKNYAPDIENNFF